MIQFTALIKKFNDQGEKTGWTYIEVPASLATKIKPGNKKSFRVKGNLDDYPFSAIALLPMGNGNFIMALKADVRKRIKKQKGALVQVKLKADDSPVQFNTDLMECLAEEPESFTFFNQLTPGHRKYFSNWINSAKTEETKAKRIAHTLQALSNHQHYGQMIRALTLERKDKFS